MAGHLTTEQAAELAKITARVALLAYLDFADGAARYWEGFGELVTSDAQVWQGTAGLTSISGLGSPIGTSAPKVTLGLSAVDPDIVVIASDQSEKLAGRECILWLQIFTEDWQPFGDPIHVWSGELDVMDIEDSGAGTFSVQVSAESIWARRRKPPFAFLTDTDQQSRSSGDRFLEQVGSLPGKTINWPL
jgi:hypothetical protein